MTTTTKKKKKKPAPKLKKRQSPLDSLNKLLAEAPTKTKEVKVTEILFDKHGIPIIPNTVVGDGYSLVNMQSIERALLIVHTKELAEELYDWDCDLMPYHVVEGFNSNHGAALSIEAVAVSEDFEALANVHPGLHKHLTICIKSRKALLEKCKVPGAMVPFSLLTEAVQSSAGKLAILHLPDGDLCVRIKQGKDASSFFLGPAMDVVYAGMRWIDGKLNTQVQSHRIRPGNEDSKTLHGWGLTLAPTEEQLAGFLTRGKRVAELHNNCAYINVKGSLTYKLSWFLRQASATGRAVVDKTGHSIFCPDEANEYDIDPNQSAAMANATDDDFRLLTPQMVIFSFVAKRWGTVHVDQISDIVFRDDAFEKLVLPEQDKKLVLSLVKNSDSSMVSDLVDNKGGGCVMLLHGKPGLGKTLTAEAVAETLNRALYSVSVGELGTDPEALEERLQRVLQTAQRWNAVLLLDEADVFLEARRSGDIARNAMVGTFLRLLEYYNGVLLLTTNRVEDIDPAFYSRISLALRYSDFTYDSRQQVVRNLLSTNSVSLDEADVLDLAATGVNGRQIKNAIRIARFMAKDEARAVHSADIKMILGKLTAFQDSFTRGHNDFVP